MTIPLDRPPITLDARAGQPVEIALDALPGAGLQWRVRVVPDGCTLTDAGVDGGSTGIGSGSRQRFVLSGAGAGTHTLHFDYKRPWEDAVRARQAVTVQVR